jgi:hypothetical protein
LGQHIVVREVLTMNAKLRKLRFDFKLYGNASGVSTLEFMLLVSTVIAVVIIALDPNTGFFTRRLRQTLTITVNGLNERSLTTPGGVSIVGRPGIVPFLFTSWLRDFNFTRVGGANVKQSTFGGDDVVEVDGYVYFKSKLRVAIDPSKKYILSGDVYSDGGAPGNFYLGFAPYDDTGTRIDSYSVFRTGTPGTVQSVSNTEIVFTGSVSGWTQAGTTFAGQRQLGIYLDGDTTHLPDYVIHNFTDYYSLNPTDGAYSTTSGNRVFLNNVIPASITSLVVPGTTVIQDHRGSGSYIYAAANHQHPPVGTWTTYTSPVVTGESFNTFTQFWPETDSVEVVILANYYDARTPPSGLPEKVYIKNVRFQEVP